MNELFRKILCSERLPEKVGYYQTNRGVKHFSPHSLQWYYTHNDNPPIEYWYESVQLPTDEEIEKIKLKWLPYAKDGMYGTKNDVDKEREGFTEGFKSAIQLLTNKK